MRNTLKEIQDYIINFDKNEIPDYAKLPEVSLYMDQLITYVNDILKLYSADEKNLLTKFMVNNYVKNKLVSAPKNKRYEKDQLAYLIAITLLKQVASLDNLKVLMDKNNTNIHGADLYSFFINCEKETVDSVHHKTQLRLDAIEKKYRQDLQKTRGKRLESQKVNVQLKKQLLYVAFKLYVEAEINKILADKIVFEINKEMEN